MGCFGLCGTGDLNNADRHTLGISMETNVLNEIYGPGIQKLEIHHPIHVLIGMIVINGTLFLRQNQAAAGCSGRGCSGVGHPPLRTFCCLSSTAVQ